MFDGGANPLIELCSGGNGRPAVAAQPIIPFTSSSAGSLSPSQVLYKVDGFKNVQSLLPGYPSPYPSWSISWPCPLLSVCSEYELPLFLVWSDDAATKVWE